MNKRSGIDRARGVNSLQIKIDPTACRKAKRPSVPLNHRKKRENVDANFCDLFVGIEVSGSLAVEEKDKLVSEVATTVLPRN